MSTDTSSLTAVVLHDEDVRVLLKADVGFQRLLPLSPSARLAARSVFPEIDIVNPRSRLTDQAYADEMARIHAGLDRMVSTFRRDRSIGPAAAWIMVYGYHAIANAACRVAVTLGDSGPWLLPHGDTFSVFREKQEAEERILRHLLNRFSFVLQWHSYHPVPLPKLFQILRDTIFRLFLRSGPSIVTQRASHPFGFHELLAKHGVRRYHVTRTEAGWKEYLRVFREGAKALLGRDLIQLRAVSSPRLSDDAFERAIAAIDDPIIGRAVALVRDDMFRTAQLVDGLVNDMGRIVRLIRPHALVAYEIADGFAAALAEASGEAKLPRLVMNHNSHSPPLSATDSLSMSHFFTIQHPLDLTDEFIVWTPKAAEAARTYVPETRWTNIRPIVRPGLEDAEAAPKTSGMRSVLHATNPQRWLTFHPWMFETFDEFLDGLIDFIAAMKEVPNTHLTVRLKKRRGEMPERDLLALVPPEKHWTLHWRSDEPFEDDLRKADLLVCSMSTTIMQALHARKPVLLWGGTRRYRHLKGRTALPTRDDRSAVYTVERVEDLRPMIAAILDAHAGRPLTDDEIGKFRWPDGTPTVERLAQAIASGDYRKAWSEPAAAAAAVRALALAKNHAIEDYE
ncbi:MAG: hypothetical protein FJX62_03035 [Alphaproteobacteria bacterium]|nr:hypothetical protein [Alphaproteobacteria bacterium]